MSDKTRYAVDSASDLAHSAQELKSKGVVAVGRYLSLSSWKRISKEEAEALLGAGLALFSVYEDANNSAECFSQKTGEENAATAMDQAQSIVGQPRHSAIYFAVDYDASQADYENNIKPYFQAVNSAFAEAGNPYKVGAYGNGLVLQNLLDDKLCEFTWLSLSRGWAGYQEFLDSGKWNLSQQPENNTIDLDKINPARPDIGAFRHIGTTQTFIGGVMDTALQEVEATVVQTVKEQLVPLVLDIIKAQLAKKLGTTLSVKQKDHAPDQNDKAVEAAPAAETDKKPEGIETLLEDEIHDHLIEPMEDMAEGAIIHEATKIAEKGANALLNRIL
ncbi:DUF1906 domain-containing protein [Rhodobacteraceae bacterium RKSG542]|uniref:DUF1906 domain-containing protein n=1 Tax=Pseudovibrio flavus TaxID=2529854 RepID=UPI0012BBEA13|nr:DUF1906 domain-containing protein [Pseudovibrio flavus]MTI18908.1 DUF1906 domain-containing protein [Pseudovibrio flavus]